MLTYDKLQVFNIDGALRGMRNPLNSWKKGDSVNWPLKGCEVGPNDLDLAKRLIKGGPEHRKFMRQIFVSVDITAPLYWWKEFDTYKVGTTSNSCSTMHKIMAKPFDVNQFSFELVDLGLTEFMTIDPHSIIQDLNKLRELYIIEEDPKDKQAIFYTMIQLLPSSYNQLRTITMNYENVYNIYTQRKNHKLPEWSKDFMDLIYDLPYAEEFIISR